MNDANYLLGVNWTLGFIINLFICGGVKNVNSFIECYGYYHYRMFNFSLFDSF